MAALLCRLPHSSSIIFKCNYICTTKTSFCLLISNDCIWIQCIVHCSHNHTRESFLVLICIFVIAWIKMNVFTIIWLDCVWLTVASVFLQLLQGKSIPKFGSLDEIETGSGDPEGRYSGDCDDEDGCWGSGNGDVKKAILRVSKCELSHRVYLIVRQGFGFGGWGILTVDSVAVSLHCNQ